MNIPNLPTDNLYKFIALSGVFLLATVLFINHKMNNDYNDRSNTLITTIGEHSLKISGLEERQIILSSEITELDSMVNKYYSNNIERMSFDELRIQLRKAENRDYYKFIWDYRNRIIPEIQQIIAIDEKHIEIKEINEEYKMAAYKMSRSTELLELNLKRLKNYHRVLPLYISICLIMIVYGFYQWYYKVQRLLDKKLEIESKKINNIA